MTTFSKVSNLNQFVEELSKCDKLDLALVATIIHVAQSELTHLNQLNHQLLEILRKEESNRKKYRAYNKKRNNANTPDDWDEGSVSNGSSEFTSWEDICDSISDRVFRRKYRMTKKEFGILCSKIEDKVGKDEFRTANTQALCGYTKVAIGLRLLCGGSYLDLLGRAYNVESISSVYKYFH